MFLLQDKSYRDVERTCGQHGHGCRLKSSTSANATEEEFKQSLSHTHTLSLSYARILSGYAIGATRSQKNQPSASSAAAWQVFSKVSSVVPFYSQYGLGLSCVQAIVVASERWAIGDGLAGIRMREILPTALSYDRAHLRVYDSGLPESIRLCCRPCLSLNAACHTHSR